MPRITKGEAAAAELMPGQPEHEAVKQNGHGTVLIEVPIAEVQLATFGLHLDVSLKSGPSNALRRVAAALDAQQARLRNGKRVVDASAALRWLIEQIEAAG